MTDHEGDMAIFAHIIYSISGGDFDVTEDEANRIYAAARRVRPPDPPELRLVDGTPLGELLRWQERRIADLSYMVEQDRGAIRARSEP